MRAHGALGGSARRPAAGGARGGARRGHVRGGLRRPGLGRGGALMDLGLEGRAALVTGGSKGIGLGIAQVLAAEGARVAVAARTRETVEAAAERIGGWGFVFDSADLDGIPALLAD